MDINVKQGRHFRKITGKKNSLNKSHYFNLVYNISDMSKLPFLVGLFVTKVYQSEISIRLKLNDPTLSNHNISVVTVVLRASVITRH